MNVAGFSLQPWVKITARMLPEYGQWAAMLSRCYNPNAGKYKNYGGRGISVCQRWRAGIDGKTGFECFLLDMGPHPTKRHSIERVNNNGDYCPGNCRWATNKEQSRNRRNNRTVTYRGETLCMTAMAEKYGVPYFAFRDRISSGWTTESAIETPVKPQPKVGHRKLAKAASINASTLRGRLRKGWSLDAALQTPLLPSGWVARRMRKEIDALKNM